MDQFLSELEPSAQKHINTEKKDKTVDMKGTQKNVVMIYFSFAEYLSILDSLDKSREKVINTMLSIPHDKCLKGSEGTLLKSAGLMYNAGFKEEAKKECMNLLPILEKNHPSRDLSTRSKWTRSARNAYT